MPRISVIIPAYNPGRFLEETLQSVINQTFADWECIVVDDGSSEDLTWVATRHPQIQLIQQENRGLSIARNRGILAAKGEFFAFVDADDIWTPTKLERQMALMDDPAVGLCHTQFALIDADGVRTEIEPGRFYPFETYHDLLKHNCVGVSSVLVRREALAVSGLFDPYFRTAQDHDMWVKIARYYRSVFVPSVEILYRVHGGNLSGNFRLTYREVMWILRKNLEFAKGQQDTVAVEAAKEGIRRYSRSLGSTAFETARKRLRQQNWKEFFSSYWFALQLYPGYVLRSTLTYPFHRRNGKEAAR